MHLAPLRRLLDRHPDLRAVIDHGAKPAIAEGFSEDWAREMRGLARETSVFCKLSGLVTEAGAGWTGEGLRPYVDHLVEAFTADRLLWGSDWPVVTLAASYAGWWEATQRCLAGLDRRRARPHFRRHGAALLPACLTGDLLDRWRQGEARRGDGGDECVLSACGIGISGGRRTSHESLPVKWARTARSPAVGGVASTMVMSFVAISCSASPSGFDQFS